MSSGPRDLDFTAMRGELREREPMSRYTSWRTGGVADRAYIPVDLADLARFLSTLSSVEPIQMIGLGSNLLVRDGGIRGTVILLHRAINTVRLAPAPESAGVVYAEAGVVGPKVAKFAARQGLDGAEFLAGIPGTIGGALAMNAGCYGVETWDFVVSVSTIDRSGALRERGPQDYDIAYRSVERKEAKADAQEEWFVAAHFGFRKGEREAAEAKIKEILTRRLGSQPLNRPNAGSVFRNPEGHLASKLIEASGLSGSTIGGAQVSRQHANFIVNLGDATAAEIEALIEKVHATVLQKQGIDLEREVRILGEARIDKK
jgi:UDP-N-acetylmuramate dehydrogenase